MRAASRSPGKWSSQSGVQSTARVVITGSRDLQTKVAVYREAALGFFVAVQEFERG